MSADGSTKVVLAALAGNFAITITKFIAASYTGSSAMLSESIHSLVFTGNQGLILYGLKRAKRPADATHPFGYGRELYFWTFIVAILIFAIGAGVSMYEGFDKIRHPHEMSNVWINYVVLSISFCFEAAAWWVAFKAFRGEKGRYGYINAIQRSKDPAVFTVLLEDSAAMLGLLIAMIGIAAGQYLEMPVLDGVASVGIGILLALVSVFLAIECKGLLIGESANDPVIKGIRELVGAQTGIIHVNELLTMHMGPEDILVNISLDFADDLDSAQVEEVISTLEKSIKSTYGEVTRLFIEVQSRDGHKEDLKFK
ncbi:MAG: cation transporter [Rhodospirillales bacterium]|nr:cation transporter [Rhodospirillales bacterium]